MATEAFARSVLGDIPAAALGITFAHEHLVLDSPLIAAAFAHILLDDPAVAIAEVGLCRTAGVLSMVDAMPCAAGRKPRRLAEISSATGVNIIATTGLHHERYYGEGHWTTQVSTDDLAQLFIDDVLIGMDEFDYTSPIIRRTTHRAGLIKVATGGGALTPRDRHLFEAAAHAHRVTGAAVLTHCEHGRGAVEQVEALTALGVPAGAILLSHTDKIDDMSYHLEISQSGAWSLFDQSLRQADQPVSTTARLIGQLAAADQLSTVLVGTDGARRNLWSSYGGAPGLDWLALELPRQLAAEGLSEAQVREIYVGNPARALAVRTD